MTFNSFFFLRSLICILSFAAACPCFASPLLEEYMDHSKEENKEKPEGTSKDIHPILLNADKIDYNQNDDTVIASGNAQMAQGKRILHAQKIIYNRKTGQTIARGQVSLKEPEKGKISKNSNLQESLEFFSHQDYVLNQLMKSSIIVSNPLNLPELGKQLTNSPLVDGKEAENYLDYNMSFAPYTDFQNKFQDGYIDQPKILMADNARIAANSAKRFHGKKTIFRQAVYSPCNVCKTDPSIFPLWQLKADKIVHSKEDQLIIYHHARLEMAGVPVFYLPYFRHADPTVKRKTGFLLPAYGHSTDLGFILSAPFYYAIAPNRDLTLYPIITTKQGPVIVGEYRHRFLRGELTGSTSYTQTRDLKTIANSDLPKSDRWHIFTQGRLELDDDHVASFDINRASDTTYLRRYPIIPQGFRLKYPTKNMVSTAAVEQFRDHSYGVIRTTAFQTDNPDKTPYIVPHAWYNYQSDSGPWNGIFSLDADLLSLGRRKDTPEQNARHMQRFSLSGGWHVPYISPSGHILALQLSLRGDTYALEYYQPHRNQPLSPSSFKGRLFPTGSLQWRYPLINRLDNSDWVLEPTAMVVGTPRVNNCSIPNEDSLNIQVEDTSLFLPQRFSGLDRVDTGGRFIYGANSTWYFPQRRLVQLFLGHTLRLDHHRVLPIGAGEDKRASDIVSRLRINPIDGIQILNRMAWHYSHVRPRISDTSTIFGKRLLFVQINHTFVNKRSTANGIGISQATWVVGSNPIDHWSFSIGETRNLKRHQRAALTHTASALYHDECFRMTLSLFKSRASDRDLRPNSGFMIQLDFKNLGSINPLDTLGINSGTRL